MRIVRIGTKVLWTPASTMPVSTNRFTFLSRSKLLFVWLNYYWLVRCWLVRMSLVRSNFWLPGGTPTLDGMSESQPKCYDKIMHWASEFPANPSLSLWQYHHTLLFYSSVNQWKTLDPCRATYRSENCSSLSLKIWETIVRLFSALYRTNWSAKAYCISNMLGKL